MRCPYEVIVTCDSASENWSAAIWDPCTGSLLSTYKHASVLGHHSLQLLSDSYLIASNATKPVLHIWPLNSQTPIQYPRLSTPGRVTALSCSPNGSYIAAAISEKIYIWQSCNGLLINSFARHYQTISCLIFNKDGSCLASGGEDGLIFTWLLSQLANEKEVKPLSSFSHHSLPVKDLYFGQVGAFGRLCSVSLDRSARIYDIHAGLLLLTLVFDIPLISVCMDIMENNLFVGSSTGIVMKCNLRDPPRGIEYHVSEHDNGKLIVLKGHESGVTALSVSVDNSTLLTGSTDGMVHLWDISSCQIILTLKHKAPIISAFFATGYNNFTANSFNPSLQVRSLQKVSDVASKDNFLEICRKGEDESWLLDFNSQFQNVNQSGTDSDDSKNKLKEALSKIQRLKKINSDLYEYSVKNIFINKLETDEEA
jgi:pre-rRNA-processing protein IPI3